MANQDQGNCEYCDEQKGYATNEVGDHQDPERICLNSECYEKRMQELAKTDIDQALEVCDAWKKANRFRWAQEDNRRAAQREGPAIDRARNWQFDSLTERHGRRPPLPPLEDRRGRYHGYHVRSFNADDETFDPRVEMDARENPGGINIGGHFFPPYNELDYAEIIEIRPRSERKRRSACCKLFRRR